MKNLNTQNHTALIIPCYNEADRLDTGKFISFLSENKNIHIIFVNDGSKDNTVGVLKRIHLAVPENSSVVDLKENGGKANAVRQGVLFALKSLRFCSNIGFLDADLATSLEEFVAMDQFLTENNYYKVLIGSRMSRMGAQIQRKASRKLFSAVVGMMIQSVSKLPINDTQCGAKIFNRDMAASVFAEEFHTDWLFDVEIFVRIRQQYGKNYAVSRIYEYPLMRWINMDGSKVSMKEIYRTPVMIAKIGLYYNVATSLESVAEKAKSLDIGSLVMKPSRIMTAA